MNVNGETKSAKLGRLMTNVVLCTTGLSAIERKEICEMAHAMGAVVDNNLSNQTTHLVCRVAKGAKYEATTCPPLQGHIHLVSPDYVRLCHKTIARLVEGKYPTLALSGLRVSISGFDSVTKMTLREKVLSAGGTYVPTLDVANTDVLVAHGQTGAKYSAAVAWKISCVSCQWIDDSIANGYCLNMSDYTLEKNEFRKKRKRRPNDVAAKHSHVFDNVIAFIIGQQSEASTDLDMLLSRGEGTRFPVLMSLVTHLILPPSLPPKDDQTCNWSKHANSAHLVPATWVAELTMTKQRSTFH